jgi:hypothetical protein
MLPSFLLIFCVFKTVLILICMKKEWNTYVTEFFVALLCIRNSSDSALYEQKAGEFSRMRAAYQYIKKKKGWDTLSLRIQGCCLVDPDFNNLGPFYEFGRRLFFSWIWLWAIFFPFWSIKALRAQGCCLVDPDFNDLGPTYEFGRRFFSWIWLLAIFFRFDQSKPSESKVAALLILTSTI